MQGFSRCSKIRIPAKLILASKPHFGRRERFECKADGAQEPERTEST